MHEETNLKKPVLIQRLWGFSKLGNLLGSGSQKVWKTRIGWETNENGLELDFLKGYW